jgi:pimeloyl-ACP methyl ester carboxylesterase
VPSILGSLRLGACAGGSGWRRSIGRPSRGERRDRVRREMENTDPATVMQATRALIRVSSHDWAAGIDVPTAVVITTEDQLVPPSRQYRLAASIPGRRSSRWLPTPGVRPAASRFVPVLLAACECADAQAATRPQSA